MSVCLSDHDLTKHVAATLRPAWKGHRKAVAWLKAQA